MTATPVTAPRPLVPRERPQWLRVSRLLVAEALRNLLWATGITLAVMTAGALLARWRGWELVVVNDLDSMTMQVTTGAEGVRVVWSLLIVALAAAIAAIANQIVLTTRTRVLLASGATRRSVALALLVTAAVMLLYVVALTAAVVLAVGGGSGGAMYFLGLADGAELAGMTLRLTGMLAAWLATSTALVALFLRWPWWVGAGLLVALGLVLTFVSALSIGSADNPVDGVLGWWGTDLAVAVVMAGMYWVIARRVPVR